MKKIKLTILFMFVCVVCMFIGSCSVNAQATTLQYANMLTTQKHVDNNTGNSVTMQVDTNATTYLKNVGKGSVLYSFNMLNDLNTSATMPVVRSVSIGQYNCIYSTTSGFSDSSTQAYSYMVQCPVDIGSSGVTGITIKFDSFTNNSFYIFGASYISFVPEYAVLSTGDAQTLQNNILSAIINNGNYLSSIDMTLDNQELLQNQIKNSLANILTSINNNNSSVVNALQTQQQQQHNDSTAINNNITNTYNFISSDTIDSNTNTDSISNNYDSTSNNAVLNFMLIPLNFVSSVINGFSSSCSQVCLGDCGSSGSGGIHDFNFRFVLPCIDIRSIIGNGIYNTIDALMCITMIFAFIRSVVGFAKKALILEADVSSEVRVF